MRKTGDKVRLLNGSGSGCEKVDSFGTEHVKPNVKNRSASSSGKCMREQALSPGQRPQVPANFLFAAFLSFVGLFGEQTWGVISISEITARLCKATRLSANV